jgi:hypothetical protein
MIDQLAKLDDQANAWLEDALFTNDGLVIRGRISLAPRRPPIVTFDKTSDGDGFTGFESWVPGGRIDAAERSTGRQHVAPLRGRTLDAEGHRHARWRVGGRAAA